MKEIRQTVPNLTFFQTNLKYNAAVVKNSQHCCYKCKYYKPYIGIELLLLPVKPSTAAALQCSVLRYIPNTVVLYQKYCNIKIIANTLVEYFVCIIFNFKTINFEKQ